ncbi:MAG: (4Fe-4S)-binding protein [Fimbriimonadaceae bacterium]|nr:(4Fe-4S)-binding protein [Fimbriimonadaceae bacterium]
MSEKRYSNEELTVIWQPEKCIHSTNCWRSLLRVFDPRKRPWINMAGAPSESIRATVENCPSGALSYEEMGGEPRFDESSDVSVEVLPNGPLILTGNCRIRMADGTESVVEGMTAFCRCGHSRSKPYCDGSHMLVGFTDSP